MKTMLGLSALVATQFACLSALAQSRCPFDGTDLTGGQVYTFDGRVAAPLTNTTVLEGRQRSRVNLFYIVKSSADRKGAVVIKSARFGPVLNDDDPASERIGLTRQEVSRTCDPGKGPFEGSVTTRAYSEYHDYGRDTGEYLAGPKRGRSDLVVLKQFHTSYEAKSPTGCRQTDARFRDDGSYDARSNRSQFSFDIGTVDSGFSTNTYYFFAGLLSRAGSLVAPSAVAATFKLRERKVEIKPYQTTAGYACIAFSVDGRQPSQVIRVNDLEASRLFFERPEFRLGSTEGAPP